MQSRSDVAVPDDDLNAAYEASRAEVDQLTPEQRRELANARISAAVTANWQVNREKRREAVALGYLRKYLTDHPERAGVFQLAIAEVTR